MAAREASDRRTAVSARYVAAPAPEAPRDLQPCVRHRVVDGDGDGDGDDRLDVDAAQIAVPARRVEERLDVEPAPLPDEVVREDDAGQRRGDVAEVRDPRLRLVDQGREAREDDRDEPDNGGCDDPAERREARDEGEPTGVDVRHVGGERLDDDRDEEHDEDCVIGGQLARRDEGVRLAAADGVDAADQRRRRRRGERRPDQADPHVAAGARVPRQVGDVRDERQRGAAHDGDDRREADPRELLVGGVENAPDRVLRIVRGEPQPEEDTGGGDGERQHDPEQPAHDVEAECRDRGLDDGDRERGRDERTARRRRAPL